LFGNLIRDNVPQKVKERGEVCSYAVIQNEETYQELLRDRLIDTVNSFLNENSIELLVEVQTVINAIIGSSTELFKAEYDHQMQEFGGYEKKYVFLRSSYAVEAEQKKAKAIEDATKEELPTND
jgi:predicted house-cleaning noncanonical NTP pyrophosphatase (MazG superfamily)